MHPPHFSTRRNSLRPRVVLVNLLLFKQVLLLTLCHSLCALSRVRLFAIPGTVARQAPLPMGFSRHEHWSGLPCPPPRDLPHPGNEPGSPALQADSLLLNLIGKLTLVIHLEINFGRRRRGKSDLSEAACPPRAVVSVTRWSAGGCIITELSSHHERNSSRSRRLNKQGSRWPGCGHLHGLQERVVWLPHRSAPGRLVSRVLSSRARHTCLTAWGRKPGSSSATRCHPFPGARVLTQAHYRLACDMGRFLGLPGPQFPRLLNENSNRSHRTIAGLHAWIHIKLTHPKCWVLLLLLLFLEERGWPSRSGKRRELEVGRGGTM